MSARLVALRATALGFGLGLSLALLTALSGGEPSRGYAPTADVPLALNAPAVQPAQEDSAPPTEDVADEPAQEDTTEDATEDTAPTPEPGAAPTTAPPTDAPATDPPAPVQPVADVEPPPDYVEPSPTPGTTWQGLLVGDVIVCPPGTTVETDTTPDGAVWAGCM